jgi:hypothetical protein
MPSAVLSISFALAFNAKAEFFDWLSPAFLKVQSVNLTVQACLKLTLLYLSMGQPVYAAQNTNKNIQF